MLYPSHKILIATTRNDLSLDYFLDERVACIYFDDELDVFRAGLLKYNYQLVYIRDPFNNPHNKFDDAAERVELIQATLRDSYYVDQANTFDKILFEDKWDQYRAMRQFMPTTVIARPHYFIDGKHIAKKRISSRSRDIVFSATDVPMRDDWIIQERIFLTEELRVYVVNGVILNEASIKMSKTAEKKTKVMGARQLTAAEYEFAQAIVDQVPWMDLAGLDIAVAGDRLWLIEVNRAPQFKRYNELIAGNIVGELFDQLIRKM